MTKKEIKARTQEKLKEVQTLCKKLQLVVTAEEMINEMGMIKKVVYYTDVEKYEVDKEISEATGTGEATENNA